MSRRPAVDAGVGRIARERAQGLLDESAASAALAAAGFAEGRAAARALDQLLLAAPPDIDIARLLAGCAAAADPDRGLFNATALLALPGRPPCPVEPERLGLFLGASQHMADLLVRRPELLAQLGSPFDLAGARERYRRAGADEERERALRLCQQEDLLALAWSDLVEGQDVEHLGYQVSRLADAVVAGAVEGLGAGRSFAIVALGKLGGLELNYSSDIDLIFVRPEAGSDQPSADRLALRLLALLGKQTPDGHLYRVDMRLRPEGQTGALTRRVSSCLEYYERIGRPWERQMLLKARVVVECDEAGESFLRGTRDWILRTGLDAAAIEQFKRLKALSESRHRRADERIDVKQEPGGIRDIETIVQFLLLQHAARNPSLLATSTLQALERLRVAGAIHSLDAARLRSAYRFHRRVENLLQVMHRVQTHRLPADPRPLARLLGRRDAAALQAELAEHRRRVRAIFERHFARAFELVAGPAAELSAILLQPAPAPGPLASRLAACGFLRPEASARVLLAAGAPASRFLPATPRLRSSFASVAPRIVERLAALPDPDGSLDRFERMTRGVGGREVLYEQLDDQPRLLAVLTQLAATSPFLAERLAQEPAIFDDVVDALLTGLRGAQARREALTGVGPDLPARREGPAARDEDPWLLLSDHKEIELLRIGVLDLLDERTTRQTLEDLSHLCVDVLRRAYELVLAAATREHGDPVSIRGVSGRSTAGMALVALGKVGGLEANYASDADLLFVYSGDGETTAGMPNSVFFARVAEELIARLAGARGGPRLYRIDTRLRPEGSKGPLVTSLRAFRAYYRSPRAALFEHQALLKARVVAGDAELGQRVLSEVRELLRTLPLPDDLAQRLREMRGRIEAAAQGHDLKRGIGGMVDIEFVTQYLQLRHAGRHASLLAQETPRALELLAAAEILPQAVAHGLLDSYLWLRRVETRLQIAFGADTKEVPRDPSAVRALALRLGYADGADGDAGHALLVDLEAAAHEIRARFDELLV